MADDRARLSDFLERFGQTLVDDTFARLVLGDYRGKEDDLEKMIVRPVDVRSGRQLSIVSRYRTRDVTSNVAPRDAIAMTERLLEPHGFRSAHLFTADADYHLRISKKGKALLRKGPPSHEAPEEATHDRTKERPVDVTSGWLRDLGITTGEARVKPTSAAKWKQINRFVEIVEEAFASARIAVGESRPIDVVDFGSGKGYLTFAVHERLSRIADGASTLRVTGVEARADLVELCSVVAKKNGLESLRFIDGTIAEADVERIDVMIALHACDTATDDALDRGVEAEASVIIAAPCCHKAIRRQMTIPESLSPILAYGKHRERMAEMLTDTLRTLRLEIAGYDVKVLEFVPIEHTPKNSLIVAVRREERGDTSGKERELAALMTEFGIAE